MSFVSQIFWFFALIVFVGYLWAPKRHRWLLMLLASYAFYAYWDWRYVPLIFLSTAVDFYCVRQMFRCSEKSAKRPWLVITVLVNIGILFFFKYWNFAGTNLDALFGLHIETHQLLLPLGISFYTFQTLSYSFDAYAGRIKEEKSFGMFCLYVSFFPQLVAGPIERSQSLLPQLKNLGVATVSQFRHGVFLIVWGLVLKLVIADNLTKPANSLYFSDVALPFYYYWFAGLLVSFKIYCDFMAYSEIARGLASLFGVQLTTNFRRPFLARDIHDFWQRWHISLTRWIGVYLQMPLYRKFSSVRARYLVTIFVMTVVGFWHGASWNFILFGLFHGLLLAFWSPVATALCSVFDPGKTIAGLLGRLVLMFVLLLGSAMFYISDGQWLGTVLYRMFDLSSAFAVEYSDGLPYKLFLLKAATGFCLLTIYSLAAEYRKLDMAAWMVAAPSVYRWTGYFGLLFMTALFGNFDVESFIYFEF